MRTPSVRIVITFHTTAEAMATEQLCRQKNLPGRLIPVPRALSADCGIAWSAPGELEEPLRLAVEEAGIETAGFARLLL